MVASEEGHGTTARTPSFTTIEMVEEGGVGRHEELRNSSPSKRGSGGGRRTQRHNNNNNNLNSDESYQQPDSSSLLEVVPSLSANERPLPQQMSPSATVIRYVSLSFVAAFLTYICPDTRIYHDTTNSATANEGDEDQRHHFPTLEGHVELAVVYGMVLITFFVVFRSDPGFITVDMMEEWDDGALRYGIVPSDAIGEGMRRMDDTTTTHQAASSSTNGIMGTPRFRYNHNRISSGTNSNNSIGDHMEVDMEAEEDHNLDPLDSITTTAEPTTTTSDAVPPTNSLAPTRRPFCEKCGFAPPLRSHHCKICDKHVAMFDHHCDVIGTCIGERNHCRFWWFLLAQTIAFWYLVNTIGSSPYGVETLFLNNNNNQDDRNHARLKALVVVVAKIYVYPLALIGWLVWAIHTFLACTNSTTFEWTKGGHLEYLRGTEMTDLPFSFSSLDQNLSYFCCQRDTLLSCDSKNNSSHQHRSWRPTLWLPPGRIVRDSEDWWEHPWQNKYWSCC